jgi:predicted Zn finger-like uncharacterized protein
LYTQCPDCGTVFRITADVLRIAQGAVRCGICSTGFNALESLRDEPRVLLAEQPPEDTITVEELPGNEMIELSSPEAEAGGAPGEEPATGPVAPAADEPPEAPLDHGADAPPPGRDESESSSAEPSPEPPPEALEFHGSVEDLDRVFVLAKPQDTAAPAEGVPGAALADGTEDDNLLLAFEQASLADLSGIEVHEERADSELAIGPDELDRTDEFPIIVLDEADAGNRPAGAPQVARLDEEESQRWPAAAAGPDGDRDTGPAAGSGTPVGEPRVLIPEELRRDLAARASPKSEAALSLEAREALGLPSTDPGEKETRRWPWAVGAMLLVVALAAQAVHFWREDLARHPMAGPWILQVYPLLGLPLDPPADLAAFELRQWGATSDATQPDRLRLRASIVNRAAFAQPYPLLRLSLQDRFGNTIGVRDIEAADYLPGGGASTARLLGPGQRADAEIVFVDPGRDAVGYEIDLCLPAGDGVRCASPAAAGP